MILATTGVTVHADGLERLERGRTYIFVSNHQSIYDIPVLFATLPWQLRIIAKDSIGQFPFLGWHLRRTGHLLVDRRRPDRAGSSEVEERWWRKGLSLLMFPEGTRSADGRVGRSRVVTFLLAVEAGLPIVPISVEGSRFVMKKGRLMTCPGHVTLRVHDPIETARPAGGRSARACRARARTCGHAAVGAPVDPLGLELRLLHRGWTLSLNADGFELLPAGVTAGLADAADSLGPWHLDLSAENRAVRHGDTRRLQVALH